MRSFGGQTSGVLEEIRIGCARLHLDGNGVSFGYTIFNGSGRADALPEGHRGLAESSDDDLAL
jgi:hypothetical protein